MSLQLPAEKIVLNELTTGTLSISGGVISIQGLPDIPTANIVAGDCSRTCPSACTPQEVTVTVAIPDSTCECPWRWQIQLFANPCTHRGNPLPQDVWRTNRVYSYGDPNVTLTTTGIAASIVAQINGDEYAPVTAVDNEDGTFTLTEKDCDGQEATCGFIVAVNAGSFVEDEAHVNAVLSPTDVAQQWPILPMYAFTRPNIAYCGTYCVYRFTVKPTREVPDPHLQDVYEERQVTYEIWVNNTLSNFLADWDNELVAEATCFGAALT